MVRAKLKSHLLGKQPTKTIRPKKVTGGRSCVLKIRLDYDEKTVLVRRAMLAGYDELASWARDKLLAQQ
jgi:hypothetical protein